MSKQLAKYIIGFFFIFILVFNINTQGVANYIDQLIELEHKESNKTQKKNNKLLSQSSIEEDNNISLEEITKKSQYFHEINLFSFPNFNTTKNNNYHHSAHYFFMNDGVTTPPPEFI